MYDVIVGELKINIFLKVIFGFCSLSVICELKSM